ncbi:carbohydrate ABC transporter permease [Paenibacillaceae bacterium WGS1546]|uniref:carbohydrate ABC transporter permease n=1 Tax=Cohnella sp. WGS1546 TaxID=3366810 RepID=UPI00372CFDB3
MSRKRFWTNYLYILPAIFFMVVFIYYSIVYTFQISLFDWNGIGANRLFVGLANYKQLLYDRIFYRALGHTGIFIALTLSIQMILGLAIGIFLKSRVKFKTLYKVVFFLPVVMAQSVVAYVFRRLFDAGSGEFNAFFEWLGWTALSEQTWLADPDLALYCLILINVWQSTGLTFILYFAALSLIEDDLYEAARIDGANLWQMVTRITVPLLRSTHFSIVILSVIGSLKYFDVVYLVTGGGPGRSTEFLATYIFKKAILEYNAGYASALSIVLLALALSLTLVQMWAYRQRS